MSTETVNSREFFSLKDVSPINRVLSEDEAVSTNIFSFVIEDDHRIGVF